MRPWTRHRRRLITGPASLSFSSDRAPRDQARTILCLLIRFKHRARISIHLVVTGIRFLRFHCHRGFCLQVPATFIGERTQAHGGRRDGRTGRYDLLRRDFYFASHFGDVYLLCKSMLHRLVWDTILSYALAFLANSIA